MAKRKRLSNIKKTWILVAAAVVVLVIAGLLLRDNIYRQFFKPTQTTLPQGIQELPEQRQRLIEYKTNLDVPWEIAFLPDGDMLVTERSGKLRRFGKNPQSFTIDGAAGQSGEGGLLGLAVHPDFASNQMIYVYLTKVSGAGHINQVDRYKLSGERLTNKTTIIANIPGSTYHDGGRLAFGPDEKLYILTGDAGVEQLAQDVNSLAGKVLRLNDDGSTPSDNPFDSPIYSYGHRNPQGLAWDNKDQLWITEHGPSGLETGYDEVNLIKSGGNYGWPLIRGDATQSGLITPLAQSGSNETWAPSGTVWYRGSLFFTGLRGESLYQAILNDNKVTKVVSHFRERFGRLRAATLGPDGYLYVSTSNRDGRGAPKSNDDKIIRIDPDIFFE